jgi:ribosomal-protein-alanine N-acetyltransferase
MAIRENNSGATLGGVNLNSFDWARKSARVGYWVLASRRGRGAASSALNLITAWAFSGDLGLRELELHIEPGNCASIKVASLAGYEPAGLIVDKPFGKEHELELQRFLRRA